jgi:hypothetical protein
VKLNGASGMSDIEGKATRVGASERGQRTSFNYFPDTDSLYIDLSSRAPRARKFLRERCWITTLKEI